MRQEKGIRWIIAMLGVLAMMLALPISGFGEVPQQISYQGLLNDDQGDPVSDNNYAMVFSIYDTQDGATAMWSEQQTVTVTNGIYNVQIGQDPVHNPFPASMFDDQRWLGVAVGTDAEMTPRQPLTSVPYAIQAGLGKAYVTKNNASNLTDLNPNTDYTVMTLKLPEGKYIYNITIAASYSRPPNFDPNNHTYLSCQFLYDNEPKPGVMLSGMVNGDVTHALTTEDELPSNPLGENGATDVSLVCKHTPYSPPAPQTMTIGSAAWTAIKVGDLDRQNIE